MFATNSSDDKKSAMFTASIKPAKLVLLTLCFSASELWVDCETNYFQVDGFMTHYLDNLWE